MNQLEALIGEEEPRKLSSATRERINDTMVRLAWDRGDGELRCLKCGGVIGRWFGAWSWLEGEDHPGLPWEIAQHKCKTLNPLIQ